ncbi:ABC transporter ATP-binding protein [Micromonospora sp. NPDC000207]|uniref:ABC transporter ATP-binding protein n=1 Tax=Micromonospora sp. NPDC000207 TaxID=3154246 RepID=UPI003325A947
MTAVVAAEGLTKRYRGMTRPALADLTVTVGGAEVVGLLGPNGAGKTTLVKLVCGVTSRSEGDLRVCGGDPVADASRVKQQVAAVHQAGPMDNMLPAIDQVKVAAAFRGLRWRDVRPRAEEMLAQFDLTDVVGQLAFTLSGGQRRRLQLVRALLTVPSLLILDEPSAGLDVQGRRQMWELIAKLNVEHGTTIVWTSHYIEEIERNCSRVLIVDRGRLIRDDTPSALVTRYGRQSVVVTLPDVDDRSRLDALLPVGSVTATGETTVTVDCDAQLGAVVDLVRGAAARGATIEFRSPSLEDAYVALVDQGREGTAG